MKTLPQDAGDPNAGVQSADCSTRLGAMIQLHLDTPEPTGEPLTVSTAVTKYLQLRIEEGVPEKSDTYRHIRKHLVDRLLPYVGHWTLASVTTEHLREWGRKLVRDEDGNPMSDLTRRHHLVTVKTFFKRAWLERWIETDPAKPIVLPTIEEKDPAVIPVRDAFHFFQRNREAVCIGRIALEAFGGLRYTSAGRITEENIRWESKGIELPGRAHKSGKRKFRQGQPANLWEWLKHAPKECWTVTLRQYADDKRDMMVFGGLRPARVRTPQDRARCASMKNGWRHSFASYLLARTKDFGPVAYQMQHATTKTTEIYEGRADELDAIMYFAITPQSVLIDWDQFRERVAERYQATLAAPLVPLLPVHESENPTKGAK